MRFALLFFLSGCSMFFGSDAPKSAKEDHYVINYSSPGWEMNKDKRSDYIFENKEDGRTFLSNSFCGEFQEEPLDRLAKKTFRTVDKFRIKSSEYTTFHNREAYAVSGTGVVDGVTVNLRLLNTRRNNCYFDFLGIDPRGRTQDSTFEQFLGSVVFK